MEKNFKILTQSKLKLSLSLFLLAPALLIAGNFYVSPSGDNGNDGALGTPWKTIQYAVDNVSGGDTVFVRAGSYNESVTFNQSGTEGHYITLKNYPGERPVIDGTGKLASTGWPQGLIKIININYITVEGFEIQNFKTNSDSYFPAGIWIRGTSNHLNILNNIVHDIEQTNAEAGAHGIAVYGTGQFTPVSDLLIDGNEIYNCKLGWSESMVLNGNVDGFVVSNNTVHDNNNIAYDFIGYEGECPNPEKDQARDGLVHDNIAYNIDSRGNPSYGNDAGADGFYVDGGTNIVFERNIAHHCNIGFELASEHKNKSTSKITMRNNIIYNNQMIGISIGGYDSQQGTTDSCSVINNTLYQNNYEKADWGAELLVQYYCTDNIFKNNIIDALDGVSFVDNSTSTDNNIVFDYNLYHTSGTSYWLWKSSDLESLTGFKNSSGQAKNSLASNPLFQDTDNTDFHLTSNSPAINKGENLDEILVGTMDFDKNKRIGGERVDMGAYEFGSGPLSLGINQIPAINSFILYPNYPNPFNPSTLISYQLNKPVKVKLIIYDLLGNDLVTLVNKKQNAGTYKIPFNADGLSSGTYFYMFQVGLAQKTGRMVLLR